MKCLINDNEHKTKENELLRNTLSVRLRDNEHRLITDHAWQIRTSASALIRDIVMNNIKSEMSK